MRSLESSDPQKAEEWWPGAGEGWEQEVFSGYRASVGEDGAFCGWTRAGARCKTIVNTLNADVSTLNWTLKTD